MNETFWNGLVFGLLAYWVAAGWLEIASLRRRISLLESQQNAVAHKEPEHYC